MSTRVNPFANLTEPQPVFTTGAPTIRVVPDTQTERRELIGRVIALLGLFQ